MKKKTFLKSVLILAVATGTAAFTTTMEKRININESSIQWKGKKVLGAHEGTINLKDGYLEMEGNQLTGGKFTVDMTSITVTDLSGEDKAKLEGHLKSDDFFGIDNYPTATLEITNTSKDGNIYTVTGNLTIKGTTKPVTFDLIMGESAATATVTINRTHYGVRYGSGSFFDNLGDNTISDNFTLDVNLKF